MLDLGMLQPTLIYNCAFMPVICQNIKTNNGYLPTAGQERTYHADFEASRKDTERNAVCTGYVDRLLPDGSHRCPETTQPQWQGFVQGTVEDRASQCSSQREKRNTAP